MNHKILLGIVLILSLTATLAVFPANSWLGPPYNPPPNGYLPTEDYHFELFGPRVDSVVIKKYPSQEAEWEALKAGEIDLMERELKSAEYEWIVSQGGDAQIAVAERDGLGINVLDLNNAEWRNDDGDDIVGDPGDTRNPLGDPTLIPVDPSWYPWVPPSFMVTRGSIMRLAVAFLIDRTAIIAMVGWPPMYREIWTHLPESDFFRAGGWINDGAAHIPYDPVFAAQLLDHAGFVDTNGNTWRNFDSDGDGDIDENDADINLAFYTRLDAFRATLGDWVESNLILLNIKVTRYPVTGGGAWQACMLEKKHNLCTAGSIIVREPTIHYFLYHSLFYWHPGDPPNYNCVNDPLLDYYSELVYIFPDPATAKAACWACQELMNEPWNVFNIPIASGLIIREAYWKYYVHPPMDGQYWLGFINSVDQGINTGSSISSYGQSAIDTFLNAHGDYDPTGGTIEYGWGRTDVPYSMNPFQYQLNGYDTEVIFRVYNTLLAVNPYSPLGEGPGQYPPGDLPWIAKWWKIETTPEDKSKFTFYLRDDVYFHNDIKMTAKDVYYTVQFGWWQAIDHPEYNWFALPPTWWEAIEDLTPEFDAAGNVVDVLGVGVDMPDGPNGYKVVFNYNVRSMWLFRLAGSIPIVPKHNWWDVFVPDPTGSDGFNPDPLMIGTGPFKFVPLAPINQIILEKNPNFMNSYLPEAEYLSVSFASNALDIYIYNTGTTSLRVSLLVGIYDDDAWKVSAVGVPKQLIGQPGWGVVIINSLSPGTYNVLAVVYPYQVIGWSTITIEPEPPHPAADTAGSTTKYRRLPRDGNVNYKDLFWFLKTYGQSMAPDP